MSTKISSNLASKKIIEGFFYSLIIATVLLMGGILYVKAYNNGYNAGSADARSFYSHEYFTPIPILSNVLGDSDEAIEEIPEDVVVETPSSPTPTVKNVENYQPSADGSWNGGELMLLINQKRISRGISSLSESSDLCTIADVRLNELLSLGSLDGHAGFSSLAQDRPDLKPTFEKYSSVSEFLQFGAKSAFEAANLWENAPEHSKIVTAAEYTNGCIRARNSFAVAITAS